MYELSINYKKSKIYKFGFIFFNVGIFLLASAPFLGIIFILLSTILSPLCNKEKINYKVNEFTKILLIICSLIFSINALILFLSNTTLLGGEYKIKLFIDLFNWIPFFASFHFIQIYLINTNQKKITSFLLLAGTIPFIITGIGQYYLGWGEPLRALNGNIIWFLKPINEVKGLSGLFSNPNYAGSWLSVIWPFSLAFLFKREKLKFEKIINYLYIFLIFISMILTNSKDTLIAIVIPFSIILKSKIKKNKNFLVLIFSLFSLVISNSFFQLFRNNFNLINLIDIFPRLDIWRVSLIAIFERPIFGWGATSFPMIYSKYRSNFINDDIQHAHNLFFEISINYGLIASILISTLILFLLKNSWEKLILDKDYINKAWWIATLSLLINQFIDVTYYDIRISMIFWVLLAGLNCSLNEEESSSKSKIKNS